MLRNATARIVFVGFAAPALTNVPASATTTLSRPCTRPYASVTLRVGSDPIRMPPMMCAEFGIGLKSDDTGPQAAYGPLQLALLAGTLAAAVAPAAFCTAVSSLM